MIPPQVKTNAVQLGLTGTAIIVEGIAVVIVEGGPKGLRRFHKLMMNRIQWTKKGMLVGVFSS